MTQIRTVRVKTGEITYLFTYKTVKNLNLRVKRDGTVCVSAPQRTPLHYVDSFVAQHAEMIFKHKARMEKEGAYRPLSAGDTVFFLGTPYTLSVEKGKASLVFEGGIARLSLRTPEGDLRLAYLSLVREHLLPVIRERCAAMEAAHPRLAGRVKEIRIKSMKSMWANCRPKEGRLSFASELAAMPIPLIDGVIAHEYAHFFEGGHGKAFYAFLVTISPNYKELSLALTRTKREQAARR